jgi:NAD(P)-dependent dehydrogenase (short-subunit alcohol dehydrogenase family)
MTSSSTSVGSGNVEGALAVVIRHRCRNLTPDEVPGRIGPIELMVNNAGLQHREPLLELSLDNWNRVQQVDLTSAFLVGRESRGINSSEGRARSSTSARCRPISPGRR